MLVALHGQHNVLYCQVAGPDRHSDWTFTCFDAVWKSGEGSSRIGATITVLLFAKYAIVNENCIMFLFKTRIKKLSN